MEDFVEGFAGLTFNWIRSDNEHAPSTNQVETLAPSGSLMGTLRCRSRFTIATNRLLFDYEVGAVPMVARAEALDAYYRYWILSTEDGTLTQIHPSSFGLFVSDAEDHTPGFEFVRQRHNDQVEINFRVQSFADLFGECNRLRGKWQATLSAPELTNVQHTDLETQVAYLEFADESVMGESRYDIVIDETIWDYQDEGNSQATMFVAFEGS